MNLPKGILKKLEEKTGIASTRICDYAATRVRPKLPRAKELERACLKLGLDCPAEVWRCGSSEEIKRLLGNGHHKIDKAS